MRKRSTATDARQLAEHAERGPVRTEAEIDALRQQCVRIDRPRDVAQREANLLAFNALPKQEFDYRVGRLGEVFGVEQHTEAPESAPDEQERAEFRQDHKKLIMAAPTWKPGILRAVEVDADLMQYADQTLRVDSDFMIEAVKCSVNVLRYADPSLLASHSFMSIASRLHIGALDYANDSLLMEFMHSLHGTIDAENVSLRVLIAWARLSTQWRDVLGSMLETSNVNYRRFARLCPELLADINGPHSYRELSATGEPKGQTKTIDHGLVGTSERNPIYENRIDAAILTSPEVVKLFRSANVKTSRVGGDVEGVERIQMHLGLTCSTITRPLEHHSYLF